MNVTEIEEQVTVFTGGETENEVLVLVTRYIGYVFGVKAYCMYCLVVSIKHMIYETVIIVERTFMISKS